jgi:hypothetical protein
MGVETEDLDLKWCGVEQCSPPFWSTLDGSYGEVTLSGDSGV